MTTPSIESGHISQDYPRLRLGIIIIQDAIQILDRDQTFSMLVICQPWALPWCYIIVKLLWPVQYIILPFKCEIFLTYSPLRYETKFITFHCIYFPYQGRQVCGNLGIPISVQIILLIKLKHYHLLGNIHFSLLNFS